MANGEDSTGDGSMAGPHAGVGLVDDSNPLGSNPLVAASAFSAGTMTSFSEPWIQRVRDIDDDTMDPLLRTLLLLRRIRWWVTTVATLFGAFRFGTPTLDPTMIIICVTLALSFGMPVYAVGSLAIRRHFLREARRYGLSRSASLLLLTRAERRARHLRPFLTTEQTVEALSDAVREPDIA